jgi:hypothetical protein
MVSKGKQIAYTGPRNRCAIYRRVSDTKQSVTASSDRRLLGITNLTPEARTAFRPAYRRLAGPSRHGTRLWSVRGTRAGDKS